MNRADGISEREGKAATVAAREQGSERVSNSCLLSASGLGCGNDVVEVGITAQGIPARIQEEIAVCRAISGKGRDNFELFERLVALARPCVNQNQVGDKQRTGVRLDRLRKPIEQAFQNLFFSWMYQNRPLIVASDSS